jgi:hypothetical protein
MLPNNRMPLPVSPIRKTERDWFEAIEKQFGIHVRGLQETKSPSRSRQLIDDKCSTCARLLFYKNKAALAHIENTLYATPNSEWTIDELFRLLKEQYDAHLDQLQSPISSQSRTVTLPSSSQNPVQAPAPSLQQRLSTGKFSTMLTCFLG